MFPWLPLVISSQEQPPIVPVVRPGKDGRGRDPWVFRCIFEDRTRMVLIAPAADWWMAFNPETCAMHKVWQGKVDFRGKVWDFSQNNSRSEGRVLFASPSEITRLADGSANPGWTLSGVTSQNDGHTFSSPESSIKSPAIQAGDWQRVFVAFDETGRKGRFRLDITDDAGRHAPQWFESATSVDSESNWQWNFKRVERPSQAMVVTVRTTVPGKRIRNLRLYGDRPSWRDTSGKPLAVLWKGYQTVGQTKALDLLYELKLEGGRTVAVVHRPDVRDGVWTEAIRLEGLPKGETVVLHRNGLSEGVSATAEQKWTFDDDHQTALLRFTEREGRQ